MYVMDATLLEKDHIYLFQFKLILTKTAALKWIVNYSDISAIEEVLCYSDEHGHCRDA